MEQRGRRAREEAGGDNRKQEVMRGGKKGKVDES